MKNPPADALMYILLVVCIAATVLTVMAINWYAPVRVEAAPMGIPAAKYQEPGTCIKFATVGSFDQYHCVDPTGNEYNTNTAGFMVYPGN